jgi:hypothetical protein
MLKITIDPAADGVVRSNSEKAAVDRAQMWELGSPDNFRKRGDSGSISKFFGQPDLGLEGRMFVRLWNNCRTDMFVPWSGGY